MNDTLRMNNNLYIACDWINALNVNGVSCQGSGGDIPSSGMQPGVAYTDLDSTEPAFKCSKAKNTLQFTNCGAHELGQHMGSNPGMMEIH